MILLRIRKLKKKAIAPRPPMAPANPEMTAARNKALPAKPLNPKAAEAEKSARRPHCRQFFCEKTLSAADWESQLVFGRDLKDVPIGQVVEALDQQGDKVAVVKLTVVDRQQGLRDLQVLLKRHHIIADDAAPPEEKEPQAKEGGRLKNSSLLAVYVETSDNQLAAAMRELQKEGGVRQLTIDAPITVAQLDPLMTSGPQKFEAQRRNQMQPFSAAGAGVPGLQSLKPQFNMKAARTPKAEPAAAVPAEICSQTLRTEAGPLQSETRRPIHTR